jgi:RNA polymerase sigma-70 factor (ECF subfamily)
MGGDNGFTEFFAADFPLLVGFLAKHGFETEVARDAASEAMLRAFQNWDSIDSPGAWVRQVGSRLAARQVARTRDGVSRAIRSDWACPDEYAEDKLLVLLENSSLVVTVLKRLPERQRVVMVWLLDGFTHAEIAERLGVRQGTVRSTIRHARKRLRRIYAELGGLHHG